MAHTGDLHPEDASAYDAMQAASHYLWQARAAYLKHSTLLPDAMPTPMPLGWDYVQASDPNDYHEILSNALRLVLFAKGMLNADRQSSTEAKAQFLAEADLVDRRLYRITARNFFLGVWHAEAKGFIGIREKFGEKYLFTEYSHESGGSVGTARAHLSLDVDVPPEIELRERGPLTCMDCGRLAEQFRGNSYAEPGPPFYRHIDDQTLLENDDARLPGYPPLFDFLTPYAEAEEERWRTEQGQ